jgi:hypothetical protein
MKRKRAWILPLVIPVVVLLWLFFSTDRISPQSYDRIMLGMTQEEVEAIIGLPPGDYYSGPMGVFGRGPFVLLTDAEGEGGMNSPMSFWRGDTWQINVTLNENREVVGRSLSSLHAPVSGQFSFLEWLRERLPW